MGYMDSTERHTVGTESWQYTGSLPTAMLGMKGISIDNSVFLTGGVFVVNNMMTEHIYKWDVETETWVVVTDMKTRRSYHAVSSIAMTEDVLRIVFDATDIYNHY